MLFLAADSLQLAVPYITPFVFSVGAVIGPWVRRFYLGMTGLQVNLSLYVKHRDREGTDAVSWKLTEAENLGSEQSRKPKTRKKIRSSRTSPRFGGGSLREVRS